MAETITALVASQRLTKLLRSVPSMRRFLGDRVIAEVVRRGFAQIYGGTLAKIHRNRDLGQYFSNNMLNRIADDGTAITTGLPAADEQARILAHRERGGTITAKADRPNPHLRIPLPAALLPSGYERDDGSGKRFRDQAPYTDSRFRLRPIKSGGALLIDRASNAAWYVLKRSVTHQPHPWWTRAITESNAALDAVLDKALADFTSQKAKP